MNTGITKKSLGILLSAFLLLATASVWAADGDLDASFGTGGTVTMAVGSGSEQINAIAQQPDGKLVVAGFSNNGTNDDFLLMRFNADGSLDAGFGSGGVVLTTVDFGEDQANALIIQTDGKLVVAGLSSNGSNNDFAVARYNTDGSLDTSFSGDGKTLTPVGAGNDVATALIQQPDGKLVVAGSSSNGTNLDFALVRYNVNGTVDTTFGTSGKTLTPIGASSDEIRSIIQQVDGKLVAVGYATCPGFGCLDAAVARYSSAGVLDNTFGTNGKVVTAISAGSTKQDSATSVAQQPDGKLLVGGYAGVSNTDFALLRYDTNGALDTEFGNAGIVITPVKTGSDRAYAMVLDGDRPVLAGYGATSGGFNFALMRFTNTGALDSTFSAGGKLTTAVGAGTSKAFTLLKQADGKYVAAGSASNSGNADVALVRYQSVSVAGIDTDNDGVDDLIDSDDDNDGVADASDAFPLDASESADTDGDGVGDNSDPTPNGDTDNDGIDNLTDNCVSVSNANQLNTDGDSEGNACDSDDDNDGVADGSDNCSLVSNASQANTDNDSLGDACDSTPNGDTDNDGIDNLSDNCVAVSNANQLNADGDAAGDACDVYPQNVLYTADTDRDTLPDNWEAANGRDPAKADYAVSVGYSHACVLDEEGVKCWGDNTKGQLNVPATLQNPYAVTTGGGWSCACDDNGSQCWGNGYPTTPSCTVSKYGSIASLVQTPGGLCTSFDTARPPGFDVRSSCNINSAGDVFCDTSGTYKTRPLLSMPQPYQCVWTTSNITGEDKTFSPGYVRQLSQNDKRLCLLGGKGIECFALSATTGAVPTTAVSVTNFAPATLKIDSDADGVPRPADSDDLDASVSGDADNDGIDNLNESDDDNDGVDDASDAFPWDATESVDTDGDGVGDNADNCPSTSNVSQTDTDSDGVGDACDGTPNGDPDGDGIDSPSDNCPSASNAAQTDTDGDGTGDACDAFPNDTDNDGADNLVDNCPSVANSNQADTDGDGVGDACDSTPNGDTDGDGVDNLADNCAAVSNADQFNTDGDSEGNACDADDDNDGVTDVSDAFPRDACATTDTDQDGKPDKLYCYQLVLPGGSDWTKTVSLDITLLSPRAVQAPSAYSDSYNSLSVSPANGVVLPAGTHTLTMSFSAKCAGYGCLNHSTFTMTVGSTTLVEDTDDDNDGVADASDAFPLDASESVDADSDGVGDNADNCAAVSNTDQLNTDGDSEGDVCDTDDDNDGVTDVSDAFPKDSCATTDTDHDGKPDQLYCYTLVLPSGYEPFKGVIKQITLLAPQLVSAPPSSGVPAVGLNVSPENGTVLPAGQHIVSMQYFAYCVNNVCPYHPMSTMTIGSTALVEDTDDDNDGVADASDAFPLDASESVDADGDGIGDNADNCPSISNTSQTDTDSDGIGDACDSTPNGDTDGDGIDNLSDNCAAVSNSNQLDWDNNGIGDACDAPVPVPSDVDGTAKAEKTGAAVAFAGDFNGDGYGDYVIGSPGYSIPAAPPAKAIVGAGKAEVISGKDGSVLASITGNAAKDAMGFAVAGNADIDKDGFADVVVGAPNATALHVGSVTVLYGGADERRHTFWGATKNTGFGSALALGDVNGDDYADVLIGAPKDKSPASSQKAAGSVTVFDGNTLQSRKRFYGKTTNAHAGTAVAAGDVDNDGVADIIVGAPDENGVGSVRAYNSSGTELLQKFGTNKKAQFGKAVASADINHDGYADIVVGAPLDDDADSRTKDAGSISVISGSDGELLSAKAFGAVKKAWLGSSVALGDVNGDGTLDIIASAPQDNNVLTATNGTGSVTVWNGATYAPIKTVYGDTFGDLFGAAVSAGDINSDGKEDLIIGIPNKDVELESSVQKDAGGVKVINATAL